jgi:multiple sugar transport system substrate-binding protein
MATLTVGLIFVVLIWLGVRNNTPSESSLNEPPDLTGTTFENFVFPEGFDIRQYDGITLNFIIENNINANILSVEIEEFTKLTGINVKIRPIDYDTFIQRISLDFISKAGDYQLIYSDPYQTLNRYHDDLEVLNPYLSGSDRPGLQIPISDFFETQLEVSSYFEDRESLYAIPFDSTTMVLYYREDIFNAYKDDFFKQKGYDWTPGGEAFTWERYIEVVEWIDKNVPKDIVKYGSGQMAQAHNSVFCEFSNILAAYGGDYFIDHNIGTLGLETFTESDVLSDAFIRSLEIYKQLLSVAAPNSVNWNWANTAEAFANGEIAMMINWDENFSNLNYSDTSLVRDKVKTAILPYGSERSANIFGGSGIGINKYSSQEEKDAAWFFITWATSKEMQLRILKDPNGGALPTIQSAYKDLIIEEQDQTDHIEIVLKAWEPDYIYLRPKLQNFYFIEQILIEELHLMILNDLNPEDVANSIHNRIQGIK